MKAHKNHLLKAKILWIYLVIFVAILIAPKKLTAENWRLEAPPGISVAETGMISIGNPVFFSRERLINEMLAERDYLDSRLQNPPKSIRREGYIEERAYENKLMKLGVSFNPNLGKLNDARTDHTENAIQRQEELQSIQHQNNLESLRRQSLMNQIFDKAIIEALQKKRIKNITIDAMSPPTASGETLKGGAQDSNATSPYLVNSATSGDTNGLKVPLATSYGNPRENDSSIVAIADQKKLAYRAPNPNDVARSKAEISSIDEITDMLEWRNFVRSKRRQLLLDDTHDQGGQNLYHMTFPITFMPPEGIDAYLELEMRMSKDMDMTGRKEEIFKRWRRTLANQIRTEFTHLTLRLANDSIANTDNEFWAFVQQWTAQQTPESIQTYLRFLKEPEPKEAEPVMHVAINGYSYPSGYSYSSPIEFSRQAKETDLLKKKFTDSYMPPDEETFTFKQLQNSTAISPSAIAAAFITDKYGDLVKFTWPEQSESASTEKPKPYLSISIKEHLKKNISKQNKVLMERLFALQIENTTQSEFSEGHKLSKAVQIVRIEPSSLAQNISQAASRQKFSNFVLAADAQLGGGLGVNGVYDKIVNDEKIIHALLRNPLVMGFVESEGNGIDNRFGWYLGPRFELRHETKGLWPGKKREIPVPGFAHEPTVINVNATFLAPANTSHFKLNWTAQWLDKRTGLAARFIKKKGFFKKRTEELCVQLAGKTTFKVRPSVEFITSGILELSGRQDMKPMIFPPQPGYEMVAGQAGQSFVIPGKNLWRNPEVYIDGYPADKVQLLGDMKGLLATWNSVVETAPGHRRDLRVVTSTGQDVLKNAVHMLSLPRRDKPTTYEHDLLVNGGDTNTSAVITSVKPKGLVLRLLDHDDQQHLTASKSLLSVLYDVESLNGKRIEGNVSVEFIQHPFVDAPEASGKLINNDDTQLIEIAIPINGKITNELAIRKYGDLFFKIVVKGDDNNVNLTKPDTGEISHKLRIYFAGKESEAEAKVSTKALDYSKKGAKLTKNLMIDLPSPPFDQFLDFKFPGYIAAYSKENLTVRLIGNIPNVNTDVKDFVNVERNDSTLNVELSIEHLREILTQEEKEKGQAELKIDVRLPESYQNKAAVSLPIEKKSNTVTINFDKAYFTE